MPSAARSAGAALSREAQSDDSTAGIAATSVVSLVVPVFNEQHAIPLFIERVQTALRPVANRIELQIIFVNDGSRDATEFVIRSLMTKDDRIAIVNLSRNFGKDAALSAGLEYASGDAVIPIDVDLQDSPDVIPEMIGKWRAGAKVVNARRIDRSKDGWLKRLSAQAFYRLFNALADHPIPSDVGDFRLLDRQVVDVVCSLGERARFNKSLFSWVGFETEEVTFEREERAAGRTTWSYWKLWNFALDGIFTSSTVPLRIWSYMGTLLAVASAFYALFILLYTVFLGADTPGYASTVILILFFGGLNLFAIGIIGEYIGRIYTEVRERPLYIVRSAHGLKAEA